MVNIGIIGCGKIAQVRHLPEYATNPNARLVGYYDKNRDRAVQMAEKYGGKVYGSYYEMLNDPEIDAVCPCAWRTAITPRSPTPPFTPASTFWWKNPWP